LKKCQIMKLEVVFYHRKKQIKLLFDYQNLDMTVYIQEEYFIICLLKIIEEALNYMAIENGIIQHQFVHNRNSSNNIYNIWEEEQGIHLKDLNMSINANNNEINLEEIKKDQKENNEINSIQTQSDIMINNKINNFDNYS